MGFEKRPSVRIAAFFIAPNVDEIDEIDIKHTLLFFVNNYDIFGFWRIRESNKTNIRHNGYILGIEPALDGGDFVFADNDFLVRSGGHVDAHLAEKIGGEFQHGGGADDELTIDAHKPLWVELALNFFEGHVQRVVLAFQSAEAHHAVADGDMAHFADGDNQELVSVMGNEETLPIADCLALY